MKRPAVFLLVIAALLLEVLAALESGSVITVSGGGWLQPAGLAALAAAWLVTLIP